MKFFVTHYTPLVERKQNIIRNLNNAGIEEYTFIEIKDRDVLTPEELSKFKNITSSEVSLFLKHVEIFKAFDDDGLLPDRRVSLGGENELVVVFEDDAILCDDFLVKLETCLSQLQNEQWDVLFSGECCNLHTDVAAGKVIKQTNLSRGACMYVLNSGVGKRLYDIFKSQRIILDPIDWWFNKIQSINKLNYFWSEPTLVSQGSDTGLFKSSLRGEPKL
jgi:GR25 family glycosyltransferase involved in LPS biosynthesis